MNKKLILILVLINIVTPAVFANTGDCATVSTRTTFLKKNEYRVKLYHLGKMKSAVLLTPGRHKLSAQIIHNKNNISDDQNTFTFTNNQKASALINFDIDVKKNIMYQIIAKAEGKKNSRLNNSFEISIKKEIAKSCEYDKKLKTLEESNNSEHSNSIPENLQYRLDLVMMDLKAHLRSKNQINKTYVIEQKQRFIKTIGLVSNKKTSVKKGINILAITPFSIAAKIGLKPEDTILSINGIDLTLDIPPLDTNLSKLSQFKDTLINLSEDDNVEIEVIRDNKNMMLGSDYKTLSLPSYQLKIKMN